MNEPNRYPIRIRLVNVAPEPPRDRPALVTEATTPAAAAQIARLFIAGEPFGTGWHQKKPYDRLIFEPSEPFQREPLAAALCQALAAYTRHLAAAAHWYNPLGAADFRAPGWTPEELRRAMEGLEADLLRFPRDPAALGALASAIGYTLVLPEAAEA